MRVDYAQQKEMLDKLYEKNGEDVFVGFHLKIS